VIEDENDVMPSRGPGYKDYVYTLFS